MRPPIGIRTEYFANTYFDTMRIPYCDHRLGYVLNTLQIRTSNTTRIPYCDRQLGYVLNTLQIRTASPVGIRTGRSGYCRVPRYVYNTFTIHIQYVRWARAAEYIHNYTRILTNALLNTLQIRCNTRRERQSARACTFQPPLAILD